MQRPCDHLLAGAGFAQDQHRRIGARDPVYRGHHLAQAGFGADDAVADVLALQAQPQRLPLRLRRLAPAREFAPTQFIGQRGGTGFAQRLGEIGEIGRSRRQQQQAGGNAVLRQAGHDDAAVPACRQQPRIARLQFACSPGPGPGLASPLQQRRPDVRGTGRAALLRFPVAADSGQRLQRQRCGIETANGQIDSKPRRLAQGRPQALGELR